MLIINALCTVIVNYSERNYNNKRMRSKNTAM